MEQKLIDKETLHIESNIKERYKLALLSSGNEGIFQKHLLIILVIGAFVSALTVTILPLHKELPDYSCFNQNELEDDLIFSFYKNSFNHKIIHNEECVKQFCHENIKEISLEKSPQILVVDNSSLKNFITDLSMICDSEEFFLAYTQYLFLGRIIGMLIFSFVSDKFGRYGVYYIQFYMLLICYLLLYFVKVKIIYLLIGFVANGCMHLWNHVSLVGTEFMSEKMYSLLNALTMCSFSLAGLVNIFIIYFFHNWNLVLIVHVVLIIYALIFSKIYFTETPLYLIEKSRFKELRKVLRKIVRINFPNDKSKQNEIINELKLIKNCENAISSKNEIINDNIKNEVIKNKLSISNILLSIFSPYVLIFKSYKNIMNIVKCTIPFCSIIFIYYGQLFYIEQLEGNIYVNSSIIFLAELIGELIAGAILQFVEKKKLIVGTFTAISVSSYLLTIILSDNIFKFLLVGFITMGNSICIVAVSVFCSEIMDINVKSTSISFLTILAYLFMMVSPYVIQLFDNNAYLAFAALAMGSSILLLLTKNTKNNNK